MKKFYMLIGISMFLVGVIIVVFLSSYIPHEYRASAEAVVEIGLIMSGIVVALYGAVQD